MAYDADETRRRILAAATAEFAEHGLAGARVDRIAAAAACSKERLYAHYGDKESLFTAVLNASFAHLGQAASAAAVLLAAGAKGKRYALPHARILIHQPHGGAGGQAIDIAIQAKEITRMREMLDEILALHTGQTVEKVSKDTDRDFIMGADEAKEYGMVDEVLVHRVAPAGPVAATA